MRGSFLRGTVEPQPHDVLTQRPFNSQPDIPFHRKRTMVRIEMWGHDSNNIPRAWSGNGSGSGQQSPDGQNGVLPASPILAPGLKGSTPLFFVGNCAQPPSGFQGGGDGKGVSGRSTPQSADSCGRFTQSREKGGGAKRVVIRLNLWRCLLGLALEDVQLTRRTDGG